MAHPLERYSYAPSVEECKAIFIASCVETAAKALGMTPEAMYQRMRRVDLIEGYILPCYNVLHTESRPNITADIVQTLQLWEQKKRVTS
ncbi:MAG: DUF3791 domain-containing protein [Bacteroidaceae bacterium]|nr:DUF3791 domain-containing protein [Bacteroidaceae bacterium]